ncbi:MAG TPA: BamA/TamA family outer membrane protein, partial [Sphingomonadales bacterium]
YYLVGGVAGFRRDTTDNLFDPTRGTRLLYTLRPYIGEQNGILQFLINDATASAYWSLDDRSRYVAAARLRLGSITGAGLLRLPADKRFYAGGGASIRGYRYQSAGPLDPEGTPIGGRSLMEAGVELRVKVTETIGVVPFLEAGKVSSGALPDFDGDVFWGAGLGLRYYTSFAPIRLDVAIPLNKRREDNAYQIYISLGQSF